MPTTARGGGTGTPPINILINAPGNSPAQDITDLFDPASISIEETGNQEGATFDGVLRDVGRAPFAAHAFARVRAQWQLVVQWRNPVSGEWRPMFNGFITTPSAEAFAVYGNLAVHAEDCGSLLDKAVLQVKNIREAESAKARIGWLFGEAKGRDGTKIAQPLLALGLDYQAKVQGLKSSIAKQSFAPRLTLRQALERILSQASDDDSADYFIDPEPRLWCFDSTDAASVLDAAPYKVHSTHAPAAGRVAPEDLRVEWDSDNLWTGFYVDAANAKVSRAYLDSDPFGALAAGLPGPYGSSPDIWGRLVGNFNAPDADTDAKVQRAVKAALKDTRNPVPRVTFSVSGDSAYDAAGKRWRGGQLLYVTSVVHGLAGSATEAAAFKWAGSSGGAGAQLQPFRIKRVTTRFLSGAGDMSVEVEAGGRRKVLYQGGA